MMSIGMHCRLLGRPGRFRALQRFLDYVQQHERVWVCTRQQIATLARSPSVPGIVSFPARLSAGLAHQADLRGNNPPAKGKRTQVCCWRPMRSLPARVNSVLHTA
jgi:hypothetical protein